MAPLQDFLLIGSGALLGHRFTVGRSAGATVKRSPFLGQPGLEFSGVKAHARRGAGESFVSDISGLLPIALCGRNSL